MLQLSMCNVLLLYVGKLDFGAIGILVPQLWAPYCLPQCQHLPACIIAGHVAM